MDSAQALAFVRQHGVVLASGKGPVPRLVDAIAGEPVRGSWWAHPNGKQMYRIFQNLDRSDQVLVCRLVEGKITFVHRRLWPALVRAASHFSANRLAQVHQEHTSSGHHINHETPYPDWVPPEVGVEAGRLSEKEALAQLGPWAGP